MDPSSKEEDMKIIPVIQEPTIPDPMIFKFQHCSIFEQSSVSCKPPFEEEVGYLQVIEKVN